MLNNDSLGYLTINGQNPSRNDFEMDDDRNSNFSMFGNTSPVRPLEISNFNLENEEVEGSGIDGECDLRVTNNIPQGEEFEFQK